MGNLTGKQAFAVMVYFLDRYYQQTQADDIGALLGSLQLLSDGMPADPAMWDDWLVSVEKVIPGFSDREKTLSIISDN